jgi:ankyrin repeat protein
MLLAHGADVNAQVTGMLTYSLRISRAPSSTEGMTALHVAAQRGRVDLVRYLLEKGAKTDLADSAGHKPIDLVGTGAAPAATASAAVSAAPTPNGGSDAARPAETRALLQNAASRR